MHNKYNNHLSILFRLLHIHECINFSLKYKKKNRVLFRKLCVRFASLIKSLCSTKMVMFIKENLNTNSLFLHKHPFNRNIQIF